MNRTTWTAVCGLAFAITFALPLKAQTQAQPGDPQAQQMEQFVHQALPLEGILGFLAFTQNLEDEQLVNTFHTLKKTYDKRQELSNDIRHGQADVEGIQRDVEHMRKAMVVDLSHVLTDTQTQNLKQALGFETAPAGQP